MEENGSDEEQIDAWQCEHCYHTCKEYDECCAHEEICDFQPGGKYAGHDPHAIEGFLATEEAARQFAGGQAKGDVLFSALAEANAAVKTAAEVAERKQKQQDEEAAKQRKETDEAEQKQQFVRKMNAQSKEKAKEPAQEMTPLQKEMARRAEEKKRKAAEGVSATPERGANKPAKEVEPTPLQKEMAKRLVERRNKEGREETMRKAQVQGKIHATIQDLEAKVDLDGDGLVAEKGLFISDGDTRRTASGDASSRKKLPQVLPYGTPAAAKAAVEAAEKLHVEEERQKMQERKRVDEANRKRMQEVERKKLQEEERKRLEEAEKKRIEKSEHKRKEEEEEKKKLEDQKRKEEEKKRAEEEEGRRQTELEREKNRDKAATAIQRRVRGMGARMVIGWKQEAAKEIQRRARGMIARNEVAAAIAEQKAAQTEAHVSEENAAAVAIQLRECGMTTSKKAAAKHKGGVDHVPDHHVQGRIHETIQDLEKSAHVDLDVDGPVAETEAVQIEAQKAPKATAKRADCDGLVGQGEVLQAATNSNRVNGISKGEQQSVQIHFTLGMEMEEIKDKRAKFQDELCEELCLALQARSGKMTVLELQAGSIITRIELLPGVAPEGMTTEDMVAELQRQLNNPSSVLRKGKYGSRALLLKVLSEEEIQALDRRDTASAEQKAAQTEAHISEENAAAVAMQQMERGMTARKEAAAKSAGGADHVPDHHVQKSIATNDAIKQAEDELERAEQKAALARMKTVQTEAQVLIKQAEIELANAEKAAAIAQQKALQMEAKLSAREALKQAEFEYAIAQNLLPDKGIDENGEVSTEVIGEGSKDGEGSKEAKVVQRGIRKRVLGAWCGTAEENAQKRMHLLAGATRTSRKCDTMSAFYALVLNLRASLGDDDESSGHPNADIEPLGWHHDSLQFQAAVRQLSAEKASETSNGANGANLRSGDSSNSTHARLARVHADLELATRAQELWNVSCPHCYGLFETREHAAVHVERCCYNPDLDTDHWAERWRCEHCSEIFETFDHADEHEQDCIFQVHDNICQVQV